MVVNWTRGQETEYKMCDVIALGEMLLILTMLNGVDTGNLEKLVHEDEVINTVIDLHRSVLNGIRFGFDTVDSNTGDPYGVEIAQSYLKIRRYYNRCHGLGLDVRKDDFLKLYQKVKNEPV